ncbi:MAG TPA: ribonuclease III [Thermomicrobiales bacterium]|nr:ribonuclease III [Thermomicrobiales bacterium]
MSPSRERHKQDAPAPYGVPDPAVERAFAAGIGVSFNNPKLLRLALTHRSVLHDWLLQDQGEIDAIMQINERLEFLGDAILGAITAERLYHTDPVADEGTLTRHRVALVRAETLVKWAREMHLDDALYLGIGEQVTSSKRDRMLAGAFEAVVGAIYLDQGRDAATRFVNGYLDRDMEGILATEATANPKGLLQEVVQERGLDQPAYRTVAESGPDHAREFTVEALVDGKPLGSGTGRSKREAQQAAAREALRTIASMDEANDPEG